MVSLGEMPKIVMILIVTAAFFVGGFLALSGMQGGLTVDTAAYNATVDIETGLVNTTTQFPTIGTLIGVGLLLAVIGGAFIIGKRYN